jgi:hypothetical protein
MMHRPRKEDEEENQCCVHTYDSCLDFFAEYLFILENEIQAFLNLIFLNFNIRRTSMHSMPFLCVCICNNNSIIGITNSFSQVESSILNKFSKYQ